MELSPIRCLYYVVLALALVHLIDGIVTSPRS
jgi:hypothetical protein